MTFASPEMPFRGRVARMARQAGWLPVLMGLGVALNVAPAVAQLMLQGSGPGETVRIFNTDLAVLEARQDRDDLPCTVTPQKPMLGFDLKFHTSYEVAVPLKELSGTENLLTIIFRVSKEGVQEAPAYFSQKIKVPAIEEDARGEAYLTGTFDLGEGKYHVDWLMRDRAERVCAHNWESEAVLPAKDKQVGVVLGPGAIQPADPDQFRDEPPVERATQDQPLNVKVLVNFAPQNSRSPVLRPMDTGALVSILRGIAREPRIGKFSVVAFNMHEQKVLYRKDNSGQIDFPAIGQAVSALQLGTVDLKRLENKHGETDFLAGLIRKEMTDCQADAVIFAGPKALLEENVSPDVLKEIGELDYPVFYMNYNLYPNAVPWKDSIGHAVKFFKGVEYTISRPKDLWYSVTEMVGRIAKARRRAVGSLPATQ